MLGKLFHYSADAILIAAILAGVKRSTGLTFNPNRIENAALRSVVEGILGIGEWLFDKSIGYVSTSAYFERRRIGNESRVLRE
ncbi:hypothetical protein Glove_522g28 [Diversispora epigaea]|uniref:DUF1748-domain-containing protein n=1 Tax=Diversispora epigaea TaxID=1348612 RepID=A0A397GE84_9GLOM|nr:hypothetical protein Glove_522g28 [Diversispora epigaea]